MVKSSEITKETEVSTSELACILGVTGRYVRQMAEDGLLSKVDQGRFLLAESVQRYIKHVARDTVSEDDEKLDKAKKRAEVTLKESKAQIAKLESQELEGKMHRSEDVKVVTEGLVYAIRGALIALPGRLAVDVTAAETPAEASEIIRKEVYKIMRELSDYHYDPQKYEELVRERRDWDVTERDGDDE
ncbi:MAG: hypothetical protein IJ955_06985 [Oscillospiraceae bacterium]|nr:hypothetical protein [Oscillospiraceae bacterium]